MKNLLQLNALIIAKIIKSKTAKKNSNGNPMKAKTSRLGFPKSEAGFGSINKILCKINKQIIAKTVSPRVAK